METVLGVTLLKEEQQISLVSTEYSYRRVSGQSFAHSREPAAGSHDRERTPITSSFIAFNANTNVPARL
jgi:hypothetical protein